MHLFWRLKYVVSLAEDGNNHDHHNSIFIKWVLAMGELCCVVTMSDRRTDRQSDGGKPLWLCIALAKLQRAKKIRFSEVPAYCAVVSCKGLQIHYTSFPVNKFVTSWRLLRNKSKTSPQHKRQVRNKFVWAKVRCVCCVVSFPKFHYNDLLRTCWPCWPYR